MEDNIEKHEVLSGEIGIKLSVRGCGAQFSKFLLRRLQRRDEEEEIVLLSAVPLTRRHHVHTAPMERLWIPAGLSGEP